MGAERVIIETIVKSVEQKERRLGGGGLTKKRGWEK